MAFVAVSIQIIARKAVYALEFVRAMVAWGRALQAFFRCGLFVEKLWAVVYAKGMSNVVGKETMSRLACQTNRLLKAMCAEGSAQFTCFCG